MIDKDTKLKNRVYLYIALFGILMLSVFIVLLYFNYQKKMENQFINKSKTLKSMILSEEKRIVDLYYSRLNKNLKTHGIIDAIKNKNREKLYNLILPRYEVLTKENNNFQNMHFHTADNYSFLRMHKPEKFGDDLSDFRDIVVDTNATKKEYYGFEKGKYGYFYRIITPVFDKNNNHLGSVEFGLGLEYFVDNIQRLLPGDYFGLLVKQEDKKSLKSKSIGDYTLISDTNGLFSPVLDQIDISKEYQVLDLNDKSYIIGSNLYIEDYKKQSAIKILFAIDITEFKSGLINEVIYLILLAVFTYVISIFIVNSAFRKYIQAIKEKSAQLKRKNKIIEEYVIVSSTDTKGVITYTSDAFCKISGYSKDELLGSPHNLIRHPDMSADVFKQMWETISSGVVWQGEVKNRKKDGGYYWVDAVISPNLDSLGNINGYTAIRTDITDKKIIEKISKTDKLTQVYNRLKLDEALELEIERAKRYNTPLSIILLDIDKFKMVNDTYGHQVGDRVLVQTAEVLKGHLRKTDILGRWGGEEFLLILSQTDKAGASLFAENLRKSIESFEFDHVTHKTASFGVSEYRAMEDIDEFLQRADKALYHSKDNGRNLVTSL